MDLITGFSDSLMSDRELYFNPFNIALFLSCLSLFWIFGIMIIGFLFTLPLGLFAPGILNSLSNNIIFYLMVLIVCIIIDIIISILFLKYRGHGSIYFTNNYESLSFLNNRLNYKGFKIIIEQPTANGKQIDVTTGHVDNVTINHNIGNITLYKTRYIEEYGYFFKIRYYPDKIKVYGKLKFFGYLFPELKEKFLI